jgi:hypothetical protein
LGVDAQLLQPAIYRLAGDQNVARHKRAHTCIASHQREQGSPISWDVLFVGMIACRDAPVCKLRMNTSRYMVSQERANWIYSYLLRPICAASHVCSTLTHFYMPSSNHKYKHTGGHGAYCSPSVLHPSLHEPDRVDVLARLRSTDQHRKSLAVTTQRLRPDMTEEDCKPRRILALV